VLFPHLEQGRLWGALCQPIVSNADEIIGGATQQEPNRQLPQSSHHCTRLTICYRKLTNPIAPQRSGTRTPIDHFPGYYSSLIKFLKLALPEYPITQIKMSRKRSPPKLTLLQLCPTDHSQGILCQTPRSTPTHAPTICPDH
jgi:hypothetical protein